MWCPSCLKPSTSSLSCAQQGGQSLCTQCVAVGHCWEMKHSTFNAMKHKFDQQCILTCRCCKVCATKTKTRFPAWLSLLGRWEKLRTECKPTAWRSVQGGLWPSLQVSYEIQESCSRSYRHWEKIVVGQDASSYINTLVDNWRRKFLCFWLLFDIVLCMSNCNQYVWKQHHAKT